MTAAPTSRSTAAPRGRRSTTSRPRSSIASTSTTSIPTASTARSRTTPRSSVPSASTIWGAITLGDCTYPGTGESGFIAVHPKDHNIVYVRRHRLEPGRRRRAAALRLPHAARSSSSTCGPRNRRGIAPKDLKYRFAWTYPIVFSPHDANTLYAGGNHVFRTPRRGHELAGDLARSEPQRPQAPGRTRAATITRESAGAEVHATCACVVESPHRQDEIWASTDDGLVHVTRDDGKTLEERDAQGHARRSPMSAASRSRRTIPTRSIVARHALQARGLQALPVPQHRRRARAGSRSTATCRRTRSPAWCAPIRCAKGLLFVGTETGIIFSLDDGAHWTRIAGGLPIVPVYD